MHAEEREIAILEAMMTRGFVAFRDLERLVDASPATLRRDLERLANEGRVIRVHGGAKLASDAPAAVPALSGPPFHENVRKRRAQKEAIGKAAAALCVAGEAVMMDGGSTTLQMCPHVEGLHLQVLTNSLHIVLALLPQVGTRVSVPGGAVFREQNIVLPADGDEHMPRFVARKLFMGAASLGAHGVMQADVVLVAAERRFIERAEQVILLVDSSKFENPSGNVVCALGEVDILITDAGIKEDHAALVHAAGTDLIIAR